MDKKELSDERNDRTDIESNRFTDGKVNIFFYGAITSDTGYGAANRNWTRMLRKNGFNVIESDLGGKYNFLYPLTSDDVVINATSPDHWLYYKDKNWVSIGFLQWEYEIFPYEWVSKFPLVDFIAVGNKSLYSVITENLRSLKTFYAPHVPFIDFNLYRNGITCDGVKDKKRVSFLVVADLVSRKNLDILIDAYMKAFIGRSDVELIIKAGVQNNWSNNPVGLLSMIERMRIVNGSDKPPIKVIAKHLPKSELLDLLQSCDIYIGIGCEGLDHPLYTAMSMGKLSVVSDYMGHKDYATSDNSIIVDASYKRESVLGTLFNYLKIPQVIYSEVPSVDDVSIALLEAYSKAKGLTIDEKINISRSIELCNLSQQLVENTSNAINDGLSRVDNKNSHYIDAPVFVMDMINFDINDISDVRFDELLDMGEVFVVVNDVAIKNFLNERYIKSKKGLHMIYTEDKKHRIADNLRIIERYVKDFRWVVIVSPYDVSYTWIDHLPLTNDTLAVFSRVRYETKEGKDCYANGIPIRSVELRAFQTSIVFKHCVGKIVLNVFHPVMRKFIRADSRCKLSDAVIVNTSWEHYSSGERGVLLNEINTFPM